MANSRTNTLNRKNRVLSALIGIADYTNLGIIFVLKQFLPTLLQETWRFFLFPIAAVAVITQALLGWNQVHINSGKDSGQILRAMIGTLTAVVITAAVVMALAFEKTPVLGYELGQLVPMIFAATIGANTLIHLANSAYYSIKAIRTKPLLGMSKNDSLDTPVYPDSLKHDRQAIINNLLASGIGAEITTAIIAVMIYEQTQLSAGFGAATALTGNAFMLYQLAQQVQCLSKDTLDAEACYTPVGVEEASAANDVAISAQSASCLPSLKDCLSQLTFGRSQRYTPVPTADELFNPSFNA